MICRTRITRTPPISPGNKKRRRNKRNTKKREEGEEEEGGEGRKPKPVGYFCELKLLLDEIGTVLLVM